MKFLNALMIVAVAGLVGAEVLAQGLDRQPTQKVDYDKPPAFKEAADASKGFKVPKGMKLNVFAAEPQLVNPVAFTTDEKGRLYVIETFRYRGNGTIDMRNFQQWLDDDLAARTVEDRIAWIKKDAGKDANDFTLDSDQVRLLEDTDGDGRADKATVFSGDYHGMADGLAAGILARKGSVYLANIPSLYELKDTKGTGVADVKNVLATGWGVHFQLLGHDLHGLVRGPDGRMYFSVGDRGTHVTTKEGKLLDNPDSGAVFRCDWDGSNLEMIHTGLRNPQELAFDQYGNLFTADNNCDKGDAARWVYIVEGGETGWRMGYQWINEPSPGGPWFGDKLWHLQEDHPAAWALPPVAHVGPGPSGIAYYPGTGLGDQFKDHFFMCDFRGGTNSGVWEFALKPKGAGFEMTTKTQFLWNLLPTDIEFAVDGGMYVSDWVNGWARPMKGRIFKLTSPEAQKDPMLSEVRQLIGDGMEKRPTEELIKLLGHVDQRVRLEAQYEVAGRADAVAALQKQIAGGEQLARIHGLWALGQIARKDAAAVAPAVALLDDKDAEVRAQAARVLGDARLAAAHDALIKAMKDESARVRFFATMGIGKLGRAADAAKVAELLRENADKDVYLRHAGVMALLWINDKAATEAFAKDESASVRLAALLVLRRQRDASVARFLDDPAPLLADEAARAINDAFIEPAMPPLAAALARPKLSRPVWLRAINANLRLGTPEAAARVAKFAADEANAEEGRAEALWALANWAAPKPRDRVMGLIRPIAPRDAKIAADAAGSVAVKLATTGSPKLRVRAIEVIEKLGINKDVLAEIVTAKDAPMDARVGALRAMETLKHPKLADIVKGAFDDGAGTALRREAIGIYMRMPDAADRVGALFRGASPADQKAILEALGTAKKGAGDSVLGGVMDTLLDGSLPAALRLDLTEAAQKSSNKAVREKLATYEKSVAQRAAKDPLAAYADSMEGGDAAKGRAIFFQKESVSCIRCHKIGTDNVVVGPDLSAGTTKRDRHYILESIVRPNAQIAAGFESVILGLKGNVTVGGVLKKETDKQIVLMDPADLAAGEQVVDKADIVSRTKGLSAMPEGMDKLLTKREIRDVVEFLATLKEGAKVEAAGGHP